MIELSLPIDFFKKTAKSLHSQIAAGDSVACQRARAVYADLAGKSPPEVLAACPLMRVQHIIAREHGFAKWDDLVHASPLQLHLAITMGKVPELTNFGIGIGGREGDLSPDQREATFAEKRDILRKSGDRVARVIDWLHENIQPTKAINMGHTSYGLKHLADRDTGYVTNGVFIAAAIIAGYSYKIHRNSPNVSFGMSERSIKQWIKNHSKPHRDWHYLSGTEQSAALVAAGWTITDRDFWIAPPGTAPRGSWSTKTAFGYLQLGEAMRALSARGWDVPGEYVGQVDATTIGEYVKHPEKAPRFMRVSTALGLEGLPSLHPLAAERA